MNKLTGADIQLQEFEIDKNLEKIAETEGHVTRLIHWTDENLAWDIVEQVQMARRENRQAVEEVVNRYKFF